MKTSSLPADPTSGETPEEQAAAWVLRLASGRATVADAKALNRWRDDSDANRKAFAKANLLWDKLDAAARTVAEQSPQEWSAPPINRPITRRAAVSAVFAASAAAAAGYLVIRPPLHLWPAAKEWTADFRTGTGEQRKFILADSVSVILNTETSLSKATPEDDADRVVLISGEAAFSAPTRNRRLVVVAGNGIIATDGADFQVRNIDSTVCVTCLTGQVKVRHPQQLLTLERNQQVSYDSRHLQRVATMDSTATTAWQRGMLIFDSTPLADVVKEINRYRSGRIILLNQAWASHPVVATFRLDQLNQAVDHLGKVFNLKIQNLPGGVTVLS